MSVKQVELRKLWGVTAGAVSMMVRDGMPLSSVQAAEAWRKANRGWDGIKKNKPLPCSGRGAEGNTEAAANPAAVGGGEAADGVAGMLERIRRAEVKAHEAYELHAGKPENADAAVALLRAWQEAMKMRLGAERDIVKHLREAGQLLDLGQVEEFVANALAGMPKLVKRMPGAVASACNPGNPGVALVALRDWVNQFFRKLQKEVPSE